MLARAGVKVTVVCRRRLLPEAEPEIGEALAGYFRDEGITVRGGVSYREIRRTAEGVALAIAVDGAEETIEAERVLIATGRRPNTQRLGLGEAGVELTPNDGIKVDDRMRTSKPGVYAAGDVTGRDMFVYMAAYGAKIAAENALNGDARHYDATAMPSVVFTDPQVASVGLTEADARKQGLNVRTSILPLAHVARAIAARSRTRAAPCRRQAVATPSDSISDLSTRARASRNPAGWSSVFSGDAVDSGAAAAR